MVNRLWQHHFGEGIVATPDNFGVKASRRRHPELLDWLATEFVAGGWSLKAMHRLIADQRDVSAIDAPGRPRRLEPTPRTACSGGTPASASTARRSANALLAVSNSLNLSLGGPVSSRNCPRS